ncbi:MAG: carotenoid biosynthesis protein [Sandaracinus sp.]
MSLALFEALAALVVVVTLGVSLRAEAGRDKRLRLLGDYALLAVAGFVGEQSSITLYRHYSYAADWHVRVGDVPLLVPLIWPLVILSARGVRHALWPAAKPWQRPLLLFALVTADASLMEVLATRADLWVWSEPGHLDVPVQGILAWGYFAAAADVLLDRLEGLSRLLVIPASVLVAHALICTTWWYGLRWLLRGDLGTTSVIAVAVLGALASLYAYSLRRRGRTLPPSVYVPRLAATALFAALFVTTAAGEWPYWAHLLCVGIPYALVTRPPRPTD